MSDTLQEREDQMTTAEYCEECKGRTHAPWCSLYESDKEVAEQRLHCDQPMRYDIVVNGDVFDGQQIIGVYYCERCCTMQPIYKPIVSEHQPAARGGGEGERFGFVVFTGRHKILDYYKPDGQQVATADDEDSARLIVRALNQHQSLVAERERLAQILKAILDDLFQNQEQVPPIPAICELYAEGRTVLEAIEQRSTSE